MGRVDQGLGLVLEHLGAEPRADAAVDPAGGGDLDQVDAATDLQPHGLAAAVHAVADVVVGHVLAQVVVEAQAAVHVARGGRDAVPGVEDARSGQAVGRRLLTQGQGDAAAVAQIANGGEAGHQRLSRIHGGAVGVDRQAVGDPGQEAGLARDVGHQMHMAVDQTGQDEAVALIDHGRAGKA
ncbi:hypothetical protein D3C86_1480830 [compost metagenome]